MLPLAAGTCVTSPACPQAPQCPLQEPSPENFSCCTHPQPVQPADYQHVYICSVEYKVQLFNIRKCSRICMKSCVRYPCTCRHDWQSRLVLPPRCSNSECIHLLAKCDAAESNCVALRLHSCTYRGLHMPCCTGASDKTVLQSVTDMLTGILVAVLCVSKHTQDVWGYLIKVWGQ